MRGRWMRLVAGEVQSMAAGEGGVLRGADTHAGASLHGRLRGEADSRVMTEPPGTAMSQPRVAFAAQAVRALQRQRQRPAASMQHCLWALSPQSHAPLLQHRWSHLRGGARRRQSQAGIMPLSMVQSPPRAAQELGTVRAEGAANPPAAEEVVGQVRPVRPRVAQAERILEELKAAQARKQASAESDGASSSRRQGQPNLLSPDWIQARLGGAGFSSSTSSSSRSKPSAPRSARTASAGRHILDEEERAIRLTMLEKTGPRYSVESAAAYFRSRQVEVMKRRITVSMPLVSFLTRVVLDYQAGKEEERRPQRAHEFLGIIGELGPAFIKAGQALSSRPDLLPAEYLNELQKLQDRLPPFPTELAFKVIEEELGRPMSEVFEHIEPEPVAAASIGQVYRGVLKTGEKVAVKVQRPNCEEIIAVDIHILRQLSGLLASFLRLLNRELDLRQIIDEFGKLIYEEIDYVKEADNATRFMALFGDLDGIFVPRVFWKHTGRRLLVMEWVEGQRLTSNDLDNRPQLVRTMVQCSLRQMLEEGFFHADPHGGNLLATPDGKLCYLDFGMMSEVNQKQRYGIIEAVIHLVNRDFESLARLYVRLGFIPQEQDLRPIIESLNDALPDVLNASVSELNFKSVIDKLGAVFYKYPFRLPEFYTAILRCLGVLEGLAIQIDPSFRIINDAYPYIAGRLLIDDAPEVQDILEVLLFNQGEPRWDRLENLLESAADSKSYDVTLALNRMVEYILSQRAERLRYKVADDIVDELDELSSDVAKYAAGLLVQQAQLVSKQTGLPLLPPFSFLARSIPSPVETQAMTNAARLLSALRRSQGFEPARLQPAVEKFARNPEGRRILLEVGVNLAERMSSRTIRAIFNLSDDGKRRTGGRTGSR